MISVFEDKEDRRVRPFSGNPQDWISWKSKFKSLLEHYGLLDPLLNNDARPSGQPAAQAKWDKINRKIYAKISLYTSRAANNLIMQFEEFVEGKSLSRDGIAAWSALVEKFESSGKVQRSALIMTINTVVLKDRDNPDTYFFEIEEL